MLYPSMLSSDIRFSLGLDALPVLSTDDFLFHCRCCGSYFH